MVGRATGSEQKVLAWLFSGGRTASLPPYIWLAPAVLLIGTTSVYPVGHVLWTATRDTFYFDVGEFVGLRNFAQLLFLREGLRSLGTSVAFTFLSLVPSLGLGMACAIAVDSPLRGRSFLRTIILLPWILSHVVVALSWQSLLSSAFGLIPRWCELVTGVQCDLLSDPVGALFAVVLANVWHSYPYAFVLLLAGLQTIPVEIYEASEIDGASSWKQFRFIVVPLLSRHLLASSVLLSIQYMGLVTIPFVLTGGGPAGATTVLSLQVWREAFEFYQLGLSAAAAVALFAVTLCLTLVYIRSFVVEESR